MDFTFHRAIDQLPDPVAAAECLRGFPGVTDVLTSGGSGPIEGNLDRIRRMVEVLEGVRVMAGGGITEGNVRNVIDGTGVGWVHLGRSVRVGNSPEGRLGEGLLKRMMGLIRG
jgi:copper homeostasis protein